VLSPEIGLFPKKLKGILKFFSRDAPVLTLRKTDKDFEGGGLLSS
jgi:hypothetical protein